jgi:hypothetical protein
MQRVLFLNLLNLFLLLNILSPKLLISDEEQSFRDQALQMETEKSQLITNLKYEISELSSQIVELSIDTGYCHKNFRLYINTYYKLLSKYEVLKKEKLDLDERYLNAHSDSLQYHTESVFYQNEYADLLINFKKLTQENSNLSKRILSLFADSAKFYLDYSFYKEKCDTLSAYYEKKILILDTLCKKISWSKDTINSGKIKQLSNDLEDCRKEQYDIDSALLALNKKVNSDTTKLIKNHTDSILKKVSKIKKLENENTILEHDIDILLNAENIYSYSILSLGVTLNYLIDSKDLRNQFSPGIYIEFNPYDWIGLTTQLSLWGHYSSINTTSDDTASTAQSLIWGHQFSSVGLAYTFDFTSLLSDSTKKHFGAKIKSGIFFESAEIHNMSLVDFSTNGFIFGVELNARNILKYFPLEVFVEASYCFPIEDRDKLVKANLYEISPSLINISLGFRINTWNSSRIERENSEK